MLECKDMDQGLIFDLTDYAFSREVVKSHPRIISVYDRLLPVLYHHAAYQCVFPVIQIVEDSRILANMQLKFYQHIFDTKGMVKNNGKIK